MSINWSALSQTAIQNTKNNATLTPLLHRLFSTLSPTLTPDAISETIPLVALSAFKSSPHPSLGSLAAISIVAAAQQTLRHYGTVDTPAAAFDDVPTRRDAIVPSDPRLPFSSSSVVKRTRLASIVGMNAMKRPHCDERTAKIAISSVLSSSSAEGTAMMGSSSSRQSTRDILNRASRRAYERVVTGYEEGEEEEEERRVAKMGEIVVVSILMAGGEGWWDMTTGGDKSDFVAVAGRRRGNARDGGGGGGSSAMGRDDETNKVAISSSSLPPTSPRLMTKTKTTTRDYDDDERVDDNQHHPADLRRRHRQTPSLVSTTTNGHQNHHHRIVDMDERSRSLSTSSQFDWSHVATNLSSFIRNVADPWGGVAQEPPPTTTTTTMERMTVGPITTTTSSASSSSHFPTIATARLAPTIPPSSKTLSPRSCLRTGGTYDNGLAASPITTTPPTTSQTPSSAVPNWTRIAHEASRYVAKSGGSHQAATVAESTVYDVCCRRRTNNNNNNNDGNDIITRGVDVTGEEAKELLNIAAATASKRVFEMGMDATEAGIVTVAILKGVNAIPP